MTDQKMKKIILRAPLLCHAGYGVHARQIARWLIEKQEREQSFQLVMDPVSWGDTPWIVNPEAEGGLIQKILERSNKQENDAYDISFQLQLPNEWNPFLAETNIGMSAMVEADKCNPEWIQSVNRMDLVLVPSEFSKKVLTETGSVEVPIKVVSEAFPDEMITTEPDEDLNLGITTDFNFLVFGQVTGFTADNDRKNLAYTLKWICDEFEGKENIGVIVKTNLGRQSALDRIKTANFLNQVLSQVKKPTVGPKIYLLHGAMNNQEIASLYKHSKIKALVSLTRGEGFGLPMLEASACGLPVIATNWSAHTEFLNKGKFLKVDYSLQPIHESRVDNKVWMDGSRWAQPKEDDAKRVIRKFVSNSSLPREWASSLKETIREEYSFEAIVKQYEEATKGLL